MDEKSIRKYAGLMEELGLTALDFREDGGVARMERLSQPGVARLRRPNRAEAARDEAMETAVTPGAESGLIDVTSPMVGVFYSASAEDAAPFVQVGGKVKKGDVLCIIEAMKLMNELMADEDGTIVEICVENGQIVDFGHVLFRLRKD